ncbi:zinc-dependent alcohol dehydrogenase [Motilibacter aurantiacus]|uniref:zinc-dependent alcohol dehydrogenase n=1 Tax=Motilibacter aurantiacus TaxID=2714955 RepID=UPI002F2B1930
MRAFVVPGPGRGEVLELAAPEPRAGEVVVDVERAGVCGTDVEVFSGEMSYLHDGQAAYPMRIGHEWAGVVSTVGPGVDESWVGRRVTGDTMLGCGTCGRCVQGRQHLCADRYEIGMRNGWPGALAERLPVPVTALVPLPDHLDAALGALVEPGGNALRAVQAVDVGRGDRLLVLGPGTIGLLTALIAAARGAEVHLLGRDEPTLDVARSLGFSCAWSRETLPAERWDAVVDASGAAELPALAVDLVEPGGRVALIGIAPEPSLLDSRRLALREVAAVGVLSASGGLGGTVELYASGAVDPRPLIAATVGLGEVADVLAGRRRPEWGAAPKVHVDPRR